MKKFLLIAMVFGFMFSGAVFKVSAITATSEGYNVQIDYSSDTDIGGYQFNLLSDGALTLGACPSDPDSFGFTVSCGATTGMVLAFSFNGDTVPSNMISDPLTTDAGSRTYATLVSIPVTVNNGSENASIVIEAAEASDGSSRLVVSNPIGGAVDCDFHEASWTVGEDWDGTLDNDNINPIVFSLSDNYPNPFNPSTSIDFSIAEPSLVDLSIYDTSGRLVKTLVSENKGVGSYTINWNGTNNKGVTVSAGMYLYKINTENYVETKKMLLVK